MDSKTLPRIIIIGAGPIGIEAALYARCLGYEVDLIEKGRIADNVQRWGHIRMFTPFRMNRSSLGCTAIRTQDPACQLPREDDLLSGYQWVAKYLLPITRSDLVTDCLHEHVKVVSVGRIGAKKSHPLGMARENCGHFKVLVVDRTGNEYSLTAPIVIDTSGLFGNPNWLGPGGIPAVGERKLRTRIEYGLPDVGTMRRDEFIGRCSMVVGAGYSAATTVVALAELSNVSTGTSVLWVTRRATEEPIKRVANDRLSDRDALARQANELAVNGDGAVQLLAGSQVVEIQLAGDRQSLIVRLAGQIAGEYHVNHLIANIGYRPDRELYRELQVHECYASEGPMKLAACVLADSTEDCLDQATGAADSLCCPEPNFFILGAKSYGRNSNFLYSTGLEQIRQLFAMLGEREDLDLYTTTRPFVEPSV